MPRRRIFRSARSYPAPFNALRFPSSFLFICYTDAIHPKGDRKRQRRSRDRCEFVTALVNAPCSGYPWTNLVKFSGFTLVVP